MKKRKLLVLLPVFTLTGCIGANWECSKEHAMMISDRIVTAQKSTSFKMPENYFYSSEYFELATSYNASGEAVKTSSQKYKDTTLMFLNEFKLKHVSQVRSFTEKETGETKTTSVTWVFVKKNSFNHDIIYFVYNTGATDGKKYVKKDITNETLTSELFIEYCSPVFDQECIDIKGDGLLNIKKIQNDVDYENSLANISSEVHYYSKREGILSYQIDKNYDGYLEQIKETDSDGQTENIVDEYELYGTFREIYGWQDNLFISHECYKHVDQIRNGIKTALTIRDQTTLTPNPVIKTLDKTDEKNYIADYDFEEPDLSSYEDVSALYEN